MPLYGSFIALQGLDIDSAMRAVRSGAGREGNPALQWAVGSPVMLVGLKAGTTAAIVVACEHLRKQRHGIAAVALMIGLNSAYVFVVAHNYAIARRVPKP